MKVKQDQIDRAEVFLLEGVDSEMVRAPCAGLVGVGATECREQLLRIQMERTDRIILESNIRSACIHWCIDADMVQEAEGLASYIIHRLT